MEKEIGFTEKEKEILFKTMLANQKDTITVEEASFLASVPQEVIRIWAKDYNFPSFMHGERGGKRLIHREYFNKWLSKRAKLRIGERV